MGLNDATWLIFLENDEKLLTSAKKHIKSDQTHNIWKEKHINFPMKVYSFKLDKWLKS